MPSEKATLLRTAAETLRARAEETGQPGPWTAVAEFDEQVLDAHENRVLTDAEGPRVARYVALMDPTVAAALADWLDDEAAAMDREHAVLMLRQPRGLSETSLRYRAQRVDERVARAHLHALRVAGRVLGTGDIPPRYPVDTVEEVGYLISADLPDDEALAVVDEARAMEGYDPLDRARVKRITRAWYRKNPCPPNLCDEHGWHLGDGREGRSGSFRGTLVEAL